MKLNLAVVLAIGVLHLPADAQTFETADARRSDSSFALQFDSGGIVSLKPAHAKVDTEFISPGRNLGTLVIRYRNGTNDWNSMSTGELGDTRTLSLNANGNGQIATFQITNNASPTLTIQSGFVVHQDAVVWTIALQNASDQSIEIGDLTLPLPMNRGGGNRRGNGASPPEPVILKHSFISGHGSFLFWMRADSAGPFLTMIPVGDAKLEYWQNSTGPGTNNGYSVYIHSAAAGAEARERGTKWRQPNTSLVLAPKGRLGDSKTYAFKFRWADDYDHVRQILYDEGGIDTQVVPGMTVPTNLLVKFALRSKETVNSVTAEFPSATQIHPLGTNGQFRLYQVSFSRLGENRLTVNFGKDREMFLEFFVTEPLETLIKKRGAFIADHQIRDTNLWYNGLLCDWNMESHVQPTPDNYDRITGFRIYEVTCDDPGLSKPAFLASKLAEFPVQREVEALDYYLEHFVWGGLQQTTNEPYPYGIYGIPDWKTNRESSDPGRNGQRHLWRVYDYPHIIVTYFGMYRVAKNHPEIRTALTAKEYLQRAYGTARAVFTVPMEIERWSAYGTGFYNELVIVDLIAELEAAGMTSEAATLRGFWERKVKSFVNRDQDLFRSEYAFDSTGFESTHALARWAMQHADVAGVTNSGIPLENARRFMEKQIAGNLFCRGWIEPAYYYLGSDYRGGGGNAYVLTYMSQMGGWSVLDYALNFATNSAPYLRLGYASYLSAWALINTGTPDSNYGYWYSGKENDGGAGGGFEPAPFGRTWLGQPHTRGSWYYSCEIDLDFCGALRAAATVLEDDPIFGRFCFGGDFQETADGIAITLKDGVRRRFHARLDPGEISLVLDNDRFPATRGIVLKRDLSAIQFSVESENPVTHTAMLRISHLPSGSYQLRSGDRILATLRGGTADQHTISLPVSGNDRAETFNLARRSE